MGNKIPNPFDQAAVEAWRARNNNQDSSTQPAAPGEPAAPAPAPSTPVQPAIDDTQLADHVARMVDTYAQAGLDVFMRAMQHVAAEIDNMAAGLHDAPPHSTDVDALHAAATLGKQLRSSGGELYDAARGQLWDMLDKKPGTLATSTGQEIVFKANTPISRSIKYAELKKQYPDVYSQLVTETRVDPTKPGRLYLK